MHTFANPATTQKNDSVRTSRCPRHVHARLSVWQRVSLLATLALAVSLVFAPPEHCIIRCTGN